MFLDMARGVSKNDD